MASVLTAKAPVGCFTQCTRSRNGWTEIARVCGIVVGRALTAVGAAPKLPLDAEVQVLEGLHDLALQFDLLLNSHLHLVVS